MARKVDLPEPLWPTSATDCPRGTRERERVERDEVGVRLGRLVGREDRRGGFSLGHRPAPSARWKHAPMSSRSRTQPHTSTNSDGDRRAPPRHRAPAGQGRPRSIAAPGGQHRQGAEDREGRRPRASGTPGASPAPRAARTTSCRRWRPGPTARSRARRPRRRARGAPPPPPRPSVGTCAAAGHRGHGHRHARRRAPGRAGRSARGAGGWRRHRAATRRGGSGGRPPGPAPRWCRARRRTGPGRRAATSGVVPAHAPRSASPAITPRSTSRASRAAGQRSRPRRPRVNTGARRLPRTAHTDPGTQPRAAPWRAGGGARRRCAGPAAWRRSGADRPGANAARPPRATCCPSRATPTATSTTATTTGERPERRPLERPQHELAEGRGGAERDDVRGRRRRPAPTSTTPSAVAAHRGRPKPDGDQRGAGAERHERQPGERAGADPRQGRAPRSGGTRAGRRSPRRRCPTKARNRSCRMAGARSAVVRSTGASSTWRTSARSRASGPPRLPERRPTATTTTPRRTPIHAGPSLEDLVDLLGGERGVADRCSSRRPPPRRRRCR